MSVVEWIQIIVCMPLLILFIHSLYSTEKGSLEQLAKYGDFKNWEFLDAGAKRIILDCILNNNYVESMKVLLNQNQIQPFLDRSVYDRCSQPMKNLLKQSLTMHKHLRKEFQTHPLNKRVTNDIVYHFILAYCKTYQ